MKRLQLKDIPELPGYVTVAAVALRYGISKGSVYNMIYDQCAFPSVFKVAKGGDDQRPLLLLRTEEVEKIFAGRTVFHSDNRQIRAEWNRRVKQWGRDTGWTDPDKPEKKISVSGRPPAALVAAYVEAHPKDRQPT